MYPHGQQETPFTKINPFLHLTLFKYQHKIEKKKEVRVRVSPLSKGNDDVKDVLQVVFVEGRKSNEDGRSFDEAL